MTLSNKPIPFFRFYLSFFVASYMSWGCEGTASQALDEASSAADTMPREPADVPSTTRIVEPSGKFSATGVVRTSLVDWYGCDDERRKTISNFVRQRVLTSRQCKPLNNNRKITNLPNLSGGHWFVGESFFYYQDGSPIMDGRSFKLETFIGWDWEGAMDKIEAGENPTDFGRDGLPFYDAELEKQLIKSIEDIHGKTSPADQVLRAMGRIQAYIDANCDKNKTRPWLKDYAPDPNIDETFAKAHPWARGKEEYLDNYRRAATAAQQLIWNATNFSTQNLEEVLTTLRYLAGGPFDSGFSKTGAFYFEDGKREPEFNAVRAVLNDIQLPSPGTSNDHKRMVENEKVFYKYHPLLQGMPEDQMSRASIKFDGRGSPKLAHYQYVDAGNYPTYSAAIVSVIENIKALAKDYGAEPNAASKQRIVTTAEKEIASLAFLSATLRPFEGHGNWGIFFLLVAQARQLFGLPPMYSAGLDFLMLFSDNFYSAAQVYEAWSTGRLHPVIFSALGKDLLVHVDLGRSDLPSWLRP